MPSGIDVWGVVAGVLGTAAILPILWDIVRSQLPATKLPAMFGVLEETESILRTATEEALLKDRSYVIQTRGALHKFRIRAETLRAATYCATTLKKQLTSGFLKGLSRKIVTLCDDVKLVRAELSETSATERKRLLEQEVMLEAPLETVEHRPDVSVVTALSSMSATRGQPEIAAPIFHSCAVRSADSSPLPGLIDSRQLITRSLQVEHSHCVEVQSLSQFPTNNSNDTRTLSLVTGYKADRIDSVSHCLRHVQTRSPRILHRILRQIDQDLATKGQQHPVLARLAQSKRFVKPDRVSFARPTSVCREKTRGVPAAKRIKYLLNPNDGREGVEYGLAMGIPQLSFGTPATYSRSVDCAS